MASVSTTPRKLVPYAGATLPFPEQPSIAEKAREQAVLFARRRMLDWKMQATRVALVFGGSAMIFVAWKNLVTWLG